LFWYILLLPATLQVHLGTHLYQLFAYFPAEYAGVFLSQLIDPRFNFGRGHLGLRSTYYARSNRTRLLVSVQNLRYAAVRHAELARYYTRPHSTGRHFHDLQSNVIGQRTSIDKDAPKLIYPALSCGQVRSIGISTDKSNHLLLFISQ